MNGSISVIVNFLKEKTAVKKDANVAAPSKDCERKAGKSKVEPAKVRQKSEVKAESKTALAPLADKQMRKVAVKKKSARNERIFKLRFETFPAIVTDAVEVPVPQESMLCEPRQRTTSDFPSAEEDVMRLGYLFDHLRLTQDRIQLWLNLQGETYPRHKK
ncbi:hypothetical protein D918_07349 [Trichuris suis]|nr:hypothetical protein D918_07349 [Trichuris suis]